jgi:hypothetical protein
MFRYRGFAAILLASNGGALDPPAAAPVHFRIS